MSVVDYEIPVEEKTIEWMCITCHKALATSMNIGFQKNGTCDRCGNNLVAIFQIATSEVM